MAEKKFTPDVRRVLREPKNLSLNRVITSRGLSVAREMGYELSEVVEKFLELLYEERRRMPKRKRGDHLQITLFDRVTEPDTQAKKGKKNERRSTS